MPKGRQFEPPEVLGDGRYKLLKMVGSGAMAQVYKAYDSELDREVALKVLRPSALRSRKGRKRFFNEASTMRRLEHPNIVKVFDVNLEEPWLYFGMELMTHSAGELIAQTGTIEPLYALEITYQVLVALDVAHRDGIVHRDIKPHNILIDAEGRVKLSDFGIAHVSNDRNDGLTQTGARLGSPRYMAPEQRVDSKRVTPQSDLYGVAASLFAMLTGRHPPDLSVVDLSPELLDPLPVEVREIVEKACQYEPPERYGSARQMGAAIARCRVAMARRLDNDSVVPD